MLFEPIEAREAFEDFPFEVTSYYELTQMGDAQIERNGARFQDLIEASLPDDLVSLCYSPGTAGAPKATKIYQDALLLSIDRFKQGIAGEITPFSERTLSHVPINHLFYRLDADFGIAWKIYALNISCPNVPCQFCINLA